ncbi:hypothetical protein SKAU_G00221700 [Synaphobranchus kaupii]|uniref:Uncharacterized protein n=1 Tax=Synaphobranchus kaupii TaxID=118154 RepID=A0A9Q1IW40_SYNKA|nr:hypothetical protein SKAU_G00221700 [Synaphobranchus kaupii]
MVCSTLTPPLGTTNPKRKVPPTPQYVTAALPALGRQRVTRTKRLLLIGGEDPEAGHLDDRPLFQDHELKAHPPGPAFLPIFTRQS